MISRKHLETIIILIVSSPTLFALLMLGQVQLSKNKEIGNMCQILQLHMMSIKKNPLHNTDANVNQTNVIILHVHPHIVGLSCSCHLDAVQIQNVYLYIPLNPSVHEIDRYKLRTFTCLFSSFYQYGSLLNTSSFKCIPIAVVHVFTCSVCVFVSALEDCHSLPGTHRAITVISIS